MREFGARDRDCSIASHAPPLILVSLSFLSKSPSLAVLSTATLAVEDQPHTGLDAVRGICRTRQAERGWLRDERVLSFTTHCSCCCCLCPLGLCCTTLCC
jgi:hypothetical protein